MLEKRCIKFIWNFFNNIHELHKAVVINCVKNQGSTLAENAGYFMYKFNNVINNWHRPLSYLVRKDLIVNIDNMSIANDIIYLCRQRDNSFGCANIASR